MTTLACTFFFITEKEKENIICAVKELEICVPYETRRHRPQMTIHFTPYN